MFKKRFYQISPKAHTVLVYSRFFDKTKIFGALRFLSSSVLIDSFVLRNPPECKARKRFVFAN